MTAPSSETNVTNETLAGRAAALMPGGVGSSARVLHRPFVFTRAKGAELTDADGRTYVDLNCAFGAIVLGHGDAAQLARALELASGLGLVGLGTTPIEMDLAELVVRHLPSAERVVFCCSGSEATYHALRLARGRTGRPRIAKFQGAYHGWHDYVAMNFMTPPDAIGTYDPFSAGIPPGVGESTLVLPFNDTDRVEALLRSEAASLAAVIVEPIMHNTGSFAGRPDFLAMLRRVTAELGIVLIFDEVISGFRHGLGGYQAICGVTPDLTTFGKAIANGFPIAGVAGRKDLMDGFRAKPHGTVMFGGTYNATPLSCAAAIACIERLSRPGAHDRLYALGARFRDGVQAAIDALGVPAQVAGHGSISILHFMRGPMGSYEDIAVNRRDLDVAFRVAMIERGFMMSTTPFRRLHLTLAHTEAQIDAAVAAAAQALADLPY